MEYIVSPRGMFGHLAALVLLLPVPAAAAPQAQITQLANVAFGTITNFSTDLTSSQSICVYSSGTGGAYHLTATGSGSGGAFTLASGGNTLDYEVQWATLAGQTTGQSLTAGVPITGLISTATKPTCTSGPVSSASLIIILRTATLSAATAGPYAGTLTLLVAPN